MAADPSSAGAFADLLPPPPGAQTPLSDVQDAIYQQESGRGKNTATSQTGAVGGWQIEPGTWSQYALPGEHIDNPKDNEAVGRRIVADLYNMSGGDPARTAAGYVSGPGNMAPAGSKTPFVKDPGVGAGTKHVSDYVSDVLNTVNPVGTAQAQGTNAFADLIPPPANGQQAPSAQNAFADLIPPAPAAGESAGFFPALERSMGQEIRAGKQALTGNAFTDQAPQAPPNDELQKYSQMPFSQGWMDYKWYTTHLGNLVGSSSPALAGALTGTVAATAAGMPEASIVTAPLGAMGFNAATEIAQAYQQARADNLSHDDAVDRAIKETGVDSTIVGAMSALPGGKMLGDWAAGTLRRTVSEFLINAGLVGGGGGAAGAAAHAAIEGKPLTMDDLLSAYAQSAGVGALFDVGARGLGKILPKPAEPEATTAPITATPGREEASAVPPQVAPIEPKGMAEVPGAPEANVRPPEVAPGTAPVGPAIGDQVQGSGPYRMAAPAALKEIQTTPEGQQVGIVEGIRTPIPMERLEVTNKAAPIEPAPAPIVAQPGLPRGAVGMPRPIPGEGDLRVRGLAASTEASAIQKELTDSFGDLPGYNQLQDKDAGAKALALVKGDPTLADAVAMGSKAAPPGYLQAAIFVAIKQAAEDAGDVDKLRQLATRSRFLGSVTAMGQNTSYLRNMAGETDPVRAINDVQRSLDVAAQRQKLQPKIDRTVADAQQQIQKLAPPPALSEWHAFANSIMCR